MGKCYGEGQHNCDSERSMGATHMQELPQQWCEKRPLACGSTSGSFCDRPLLVESEQIQHAATQIPQRTLHEHISESFWELYCPHTPHRIPDKFTDGLACSWKNHTHLSPLQTLSSGNFSMRTPMTFRRPAVSTGSKQRDRTSRKRNIFDLHT